MSLSGLHSLIFRVKCGAYIGVLWISNLWIGENWCMSHRWLVCFSMYVSSVSLWSRNRLWSKRCCICGVGVSLPIWWWLGLCSIGLGRISWWLKLPIYLLGRWFLYLFVFQYIFLERCIWLYLSSINLFGEIEYFTIHFFNVVWLILHFLERILEVEVKSAHC